MGYWKPMLLNNLEKIEKHYKIKINTDMMDEISARLTYLLWLADTDDSAKVLICSDCKGTTWKWFGDSCKICTKCERPMVLTQETQNE